MWQVCMKLAVISFGSFISTEIDDLLPVTSPVQPVNTQWRAGIAVSHAVRPGLTGHALPPYRCLPV